MRPTIRFAVAAAVAASLAAPALAASLNDKERARVARAAAADRDDVRYCLLKRKEGKKKGAIVGAVGGAGTMVVAGESVGEAALAAGVGALAGQAIGKGTATNKTCDRVLARNP
jgi:outer membrane lipoprotein SlyB